MRVKDWERKLGEFISSRQGQPFAWGVSDCSLFACDAALEITGVDFAQEFRNRYDSALSATRTIQAFTDGGDLEDLATKVALQFELEEVKPLFAQRGDIVLLYDDQNRKALAIVGMDGWKVVGPGPRSYQLTDGVRAWRV